MAVKFETDNKENTHLDGVFINFTNHPSAAWPSEQVNAAQEYGRIIDVPFPTVDPQGDEAYIEMVANHYEEVIMSYHPVAVLCQGEFCVAYQIISRLKKKGITVLAACSERITETSGNCKTSVFEFRRFRRL